MKATNFMPKTSFLSKSLLMGLDHSYSDQLLATAGKVVQIWSYDRSEPIQTFNWGGAIDTITKIKFNPSESNLIAATCMDRSICLYDIRGKTPL